MIASNNALQFSASLTGTPIVVTGTSTPGTIIHTASNEAKDFMWIYLANPTGDVPRTVTIEIGGIIDNRVIVEPQSNKILVQPGIPVSGGQQVSVYADGTGVVVSGFVHRRIEVS